MLSDVCSRNLGQPDEAVRAMAEARTLFQALGLAARLAGLSAR